MELTRDYGRVRFSATVIRAALARWKSLAGPDPAATYYVLHVYRGSDRWSFDSIDELTADLENQYSAVHIAAQNGNGWKFSIFQSTECSVSIGAPRKVDIAKVLPAFDDAREASALPPEPVSREPALTVFIGHGGSVDWRDLKDHLTDKWKIDVSAYEVGSRAGHAIRDVLDDMLRGSSMAVLVMTGEDETAAGEFRARQNVVHETGLFQGRLGFGRALVVVEQGVELYSNLDGIQQIRYTRGNIREAFGDVVAAIRAEFPSSL